MTAFFLTLTPRTASGAPATVRLGHAPDGRPLRYGNHAFWAGLAQLPVVSQRLAVAEDGFGGILKPRQMRISYRSGEPGRLEFLRGLFWKGAAATVVADPGGTVITGKVTDSQVRDGVLQLTIVDAAAELGRALISATFAGTGSLEGDSNAEGRLKRRSWGRNVNVEALPLLAAENVYELGDPARPLGSILAVRDRGNAASGVLTVSWQGSALATLNALRSVDLGNGTTNQVAVAPSIACLKWWTRPSGPLTADLQGETAGGYTETAAGIAERIVSAIDGPAFVAGTVAAAEAARPGAAGIHVGSAADVNGILVALLGGVSLFHLVTPAGKIELGAWGFAEPVAELSSVSSARDQVLAPAKAVELGYQVNNRVHSDGEIASVVSASQIAGEIDFDGQVGGVGKPELFADVTGNNTAAFLAGQGLLATRDAADFFNNVVGKPFALNSFNAGGYLYATRMVYGNAVTVDALRPGEAGANVTETRTAAFFANQGALATLSQVSRLNVTSDFMRLRNLLPDPHFENLSEFWPQYNTSGLGSNSYITTNAGDLSVTGAPKRALAMRCANLTNTTSSHLFYYHNSTLMPIDGPCTVAIEVGMYSNNMPSGSRAYVTLQVMNAQGAEIASNLNRVYGPDGSYNLRTQVRAPAGATEVRTQLVIQLEPGETVTTSSVVVWGAPRVYVAPELGTDLVRENGDLLTDALAVTSLGTAAFLAGQGLLATKNTADFFNDVVGRPFALSAFDASGHLYASRTVFSNGGPSIEALKPQEAGANVTENRTAAYLANQGLLATQSSVAFGTYRILENPLGAQATLPNFKTNQGTAAFIAGQSSWATYSSLTPTTVEGRTQNLDLLGVITTIEVVSVVMVAGAKMSTNISATASTNSSGSSTISVPSHNIYIPGASGSRTVSYNSGSITGLSPSTRYYVYCDDPGYSGGSKTYHATTSARVLQVLGRRHVTTITTPASSSSGSTGGTGGGGGYTPPDEWNPTNPNEQIP